MKTALVLACDDNFIPYTSVIARRIGHLASEKFPIFVLSDGVTDQNKRLAKKFCPAINFIEASPLLEDKPVRGFRSAYARLFMDELLPDLDRAVYLDSDVSPLTDVSPLLSLTPKVAPVIAAYDLPIMAEGKVRRRLPMMSPGSGYFNSGVMVFDLKALREEHTLAEAMRFSVEHPDQCLYVDQDALNVVFNGRWQVMDWRWNAITFMVNRLPKRPFIRHLTGHKPWGPYKQSIEPDIVEQWRLKSLGKPLAGIVQTGASTACQVWGEPGSQHDDPYGCGCIPCKRKKQARTAGPLSQKLPGRCFDDRGAARRNGG